MKPVISGIVAVMVIFLACGEVTAVNTHPIVAATYFGGSSQDQGWPSTPAVIDADGNIVFAIYTASPGLATAGAYDVSSNGSNDVLVVKMNPQLTSVLAATYLGGSGNESAFSIGLGTDGRIYVGGNTYSSNFPFSAGAYDIVRAAEEGFVAIFSADLDTLVASTFIGGSGNDRIDDIAVAADGSVFAIIQTASTNLTATPGAIGASYYGGSIDYFIAHLNSTLTAASAASYIGGNSDEYRARLHLDANGDIYITGCTFSTNMPVTAGAYDAVNGGGSMDAFIMHATADLTTVLACTYLGGNYTDWIYCVDLAADGDLYISGHASGGWPVTHGCFDSTYGGPVDGEDSYVSRISSDLTTVKASTFLGGTAWDWGVDIVVDSMGYVYVVGETESANFPLTPDAYDKTKGGGTDMFISILDSTMSRLHMSTFIGGANADRWPGLLCDGDGNSYVIGYTESSGLTTTAGAYDPTYNAAGDMYLAKFNFNAFTRITSGPIWDDADCSHNVHWVDYNSDGYLDLYITHWYYDRDHVNALYRNDGSGGFIKVTDGSIVADVQGMCATWADFDNDGDVDAYVGSPGTSAGWRKNYFYINNGDGSFAKQTSGSVANDLGMAVSASWGDFDNDGDLDLLVGNHCPPPCTGGVGPFYYRNDGDSLARLTRQQVGLEAGDFAYHVVCDFDDDGDLDIVHRRNEQTNMVYRNQGNGTFVRDQTVAFASDFSSGFSWADYDNDGDFDLLAMRDDGCPLYRNDLGTFAVVASSAFDPGGGSWFSGDWGDYDNDGDLDIFLAGFVGMFAPKANALMRNNGDGTFAKVISDPISTDLEPSIGAAWGDYDRDGDLDLVVANQNYYHNALYHNNGNGNAWLEVHCQGVTSNRSAIGARVIVVATIDGQSVRQMRAIASQSNSFAQGPLEAHFGLGDAAVIDSVIVTWPSKMIDIFTDVPVNQLFMVSESVRGDANDDGTINVGDAVHIINYVFKGGPPPDPEASGDANCDETINVGDAVHIINYVFKGGPEPGCLGR